GRRLQQQGFNEDVRRAPAAQANFVELAVPDGVAVAPNSKSAILSHVLPLSLTRLDEMLRQGL
ncbi:hypothetical protein, partial [Mycolicibacterium sp.]|uniref:hypothetical protein n=1 Tax=Mycolicibacterium sp. TaxID=2320850 RepID=UPI0025DA79AE